MIWFSPHTGEWEAETYEEALEEERDYLVEALRSLRGEETHAMEGTGWTAKRIVSYAVLNKRINDLLARA